MQAYIVQGLMLLYLKAHQVDTGFTQSQVNTYPIPTHAIGIVAEFGASIAIDRYNRRLSLGYFFCAIQIACSVVLLVPNMSMAGHLTAFYLSSTSYGINPLLYSWSNIIAARTADDAARSVILASMAASDGLLWTFWGIVFYPASDAPHWRKGYITLLCVCAALCCWLFVVRWVSYLPLSGHLLESDMNLCTGRSIHRQEAPGHHATSFRRPGPNRHHLCPGDGREAGVSHSRLAIASWQRDQCRSMEMADTLGNLIHVRNAIMGGFSIGAAETGEEQWQRIIDQSCGSWKLSQSMDKAAGVGRAQTPTPTNINNIQEIV